MEVLREETPEENEIRIMVVDDEPQNMRLVEIKLRREYDIMMVESGEKAIQLLNDGEKFDLILLDQMMPNMDGIMTFIEMQSQELLSGIPVIMATAHGSIKLATTFMQMGGADFIEKPIVDAESLKLKISQALNTATLIKTQQRMEEDLARIQKLESIGVLAGGIAHDFNNYLTRILGNISVARIKVDSKEEVLDRLADAEKELLRTRNLTQQLLTFSEGGLPIKKPCSVVQLLEESMIFSLRGTNVKCEFSMPNNLWLINVDEGQIDQVISNLAINADQAMPQGGIISVTAENVGYDALPNPMKAEKYVKIVIRDQGVGISKDYLEKIFDPYFTTKQKGHGLGLAISYSIVKKHDGDITVESQIGVGTTFTIFLPAAAEQEMPEKAAEEKESGVIRGDGKVLVVDDDKSIRDVAKIMLEGVGYEVVLAADGAEAIGLYSEAKESNKPFDIAVIDLTIPGGMGGKEAIQELLKMDSNIKAIVSSGYANSPIMAEYEKHGFCGVIAKPYGLDRLSQALHDAITGAKCEY